KGKLAGKIVLYGDDPEIKLPVEPLADRLDDKALAGINQYSVPSERNEQRIRELQRRGRLQRTLAKFFADEQALAVVEHSRGSIGGGTVYVDGGAYKGGQTIGLPWIIMAGGQGNRITRAGNEKNEAEIETHVKK